MEMEQKNFTRSEMVSGGYYAKCIDLIKSMNYGEIRKLDKSKPSYSRFVSTMKQLMDDNMDRFLQCEIEFNGDYSAFRKLDLVNCL